MNDTDVRTAPAAPVLRRDAEGVFERAVAGGPAAPAALRRLAAARLRAWGLDAIAADVLLVVSELATNAVRASGAGTLVGLRLMVWRAVLSVEVYDGSTAPAVPAPPPAVPEDAESGRGLAIVAALARHWGQRRDPDGKTVYALLDLP
ncbi:ATP-binding protein [Actinomadura parmotrematis]|uniref:ATP-binding protein n=1 Tax=Actinomadura parmotrematis TaxID=2864039 RepID=A0ABS7FRG1_9ACTN|nr:ATP-binding protein [Actinomadura parmotrematis]MBW8482989.1 ATP-binding protein [Actinomadura parmotrematis]